MKFQIDKLKHLAVGLVVACGVYFITRDMLWTIGATVAIATAKEAWDATGRGHVEFRDWLATIVPAGIPSIYHVNAAGLW